MKKLLVLLLTVLMVLGLTACGQNKPQSPKPDSIKVAGLLGGYGDAGWKAVAEAFEKETGIKVELTLEKNIADTLRPAIQAGKDIPDAIYLAVGSTGGITDTMIAEKQVTEINDLLDVTVPGEKVTVKEKLLPGFTEALSVSPYGDGKLYLAPINYSPCGLFYNAKLFEDKGWKVPTTFEEMFKLAEQAKAEGIALFTYPTTGYFDAFFSALLNEAVGPEKYAKLMKYDLETWKSPETKKAFEIVGQLAKYTEANTVANANKEGFTKNQQLILNNKALFIPNGTWLPAEMKDAPRAEGFKWGFTALPKLTADGDAYATTFTEQIWIPSGAKNVDAAKQFIAFLYSDVAVKLFAEKSNAFMPTKTASAAITDNETKMMLSIYDGGAKANAVGFASHATVEGVDLTGPEGILYGTVNSVVNGSKSVDEWYDGVIKAVEAYNK